MELLAHDDSLTDEIRKSLDPFLVSDFDAQVYSREILQHSALPLAEHLSAIDVSISALDNSLKNRVLDDHEVLTKNITVINDLETSLLELEVSAGTLLESNAGTVRSFRALYEEHCQNLEEFERTKAALDLLRRSTKVAQIAKRIRNAQRENLGLRKIAVALSDLGKLHRSSELENVTSVSVDLTFVRGISESFPGTVPQVLAEAVQKQDLGVTGDALDAAIVLNTASRILHDTKKAFLLNVERFIEEGLNIHLLTQSDAGKNAGKMPGRTTLPSVQTSPALRTAFWAKIDSIFDSIYQNQIRIELLESVYIRRYGEHALYEPDAQEIEEGVLSVQFFEEASDGLRVALVKCGKESSFLQQMLENEYPKLLKILRDTINRLRNVSLFLDMSAVDGIEGRDAATLRNSIAPFQELFVSRSLSRLLDPVNVGFSDSSTPPSTEDVDNIMRAVTSELLVCSSDEALAVLLCKNIGKCLRMAFIKLDEMVATDGEATQVFGPLAAKQAKNYKIVKAAVYLRERIQQILDTTNVTLPPEGNAAIASVLPGYVVAVQNVLQPLVASLLDSCEAILLTMHQEDFSGGDGEVEQGNEMLDSPSSLYMRELQDFMFPGAYGLFPLSIGSGSSFDENVAELASVLLLQEFLLRAQQNFFVPLDTSKAIIRSFIVRFAQRCLELFVRHVSLIRPVGKQGRLKLATDCAQLEAALAPLNLHHSEYGSALQALKALRPLLFQTPLQISESPYLGTALPYSLVLHHLFSRAPLDLQSPFQASGWSISRYSRYLDEHPKEVDRLMIIKASLDSYAHMVQDRGETHYAVIYPLMKEMLSNAFEISSQ